MEKEIPKRNDNENRGIVDAIMKEIVTNIPKQDQDNHRISDVIEADEHQKDLEIEKLNDQIIKVVEENDVMQTKIANLQQERIQQDIKTARLEGEKQNLEETVKSGYEQYEALFKEYEKIKAENKKHVKDYEAKLSTINNELIKSYSKVDQLFKENIKLQEEKKVLEGIHSADERLRDDTEDEHVEKHTDQEKSCTKCDYVTDKDDSLRDHLKIHEEQNIFDCELCDFRGKTKIKEKHFKARHRNQNIHNFNCRKCDYTTSKETILREHMRIHGEPEPFMCKGCDFVGKSRIQMEKHFMIRHKKAAECYFWRKGRCNKGSNCPYSHQVKDPVCRNGEFCQFWPKRRFNHPEICRFQNACLNKFCPFVHVDNEEYAFLENGRSLKNPLQNQETPMWRPW